MSDMLQAAIPYFTVAGVYRVRSIERARERFEEALADYDGPVTDQLFGQLMAHGEEMKAKRLAEATAKEERRIERERVRAEKEAAKAALPIATGFTSLDEKISRLPQGRYLLSAIQNNTVIDETALACFLSFCKHNNAKLMLGRMTYNKNAFRQPDIDDGEAWFAKEAEPYIVEGHIDLGGKVHFLADANIIPTAQWPTSGFDGNTPAGISAIVPASKIELRVTAANKNSPTKVIAATGAITQRNYIMRKTGARAAAAHCISAVFVDTLASPAIIRHIELMPDSDCIYDLSGVYSADGFGGALNQGDVAAFQAGDIHAEKIEQSNLDFILDFIKEYKPDNIFLHDLLDFSSRNHHNIKDPFFLVAQEMAGNTVASDLNTMSHVLDDISSHAARYYGTVHIVESNHDLAIDTWLKNVDWRYDPINAHTYLTLAQAKVAAIKDGESEFNTLAWCYVNFCNGEYENFIRFHKVDDSVIVAGIEMANHGHNGANGSRGSPKQFASLGVPMNTGHTHSPSIYGKVYTAGVSASLDMGYNVGASSWAIAHIMTYRNGQRQIIFA